MELWRYYGILRRRIWLILVCAVVCVGVVGVYLQSLPKQYEGVTQVIERAPSDRGVTVYPQMYAAPQTVDMHLTDLGMIATSITVRQRAYEALSSENISLNPEMLLENMSVEPVPGSQIITIKVTSNNGEEAAKAADAIRREFVRYYRELTVGPTVGSRVFIEKQLEDAKSKLEKSREARMKFQTQNAVVLMDAQSQVLIQKVAEIETQRIAADVSAGEAANRLSVIDGELNREPEMKLSQSNIADNPIYQKLLSDKVQLESELGTQIATRGNHHPEVMALRKRLAETDAQIRTQAPKIVAQEIKSQNQVYTQALISRLGTEADRAGAAARQSALESALASKKAEMDDMPARAMKMAQYDLDVRSAESTYALLLQKLDEARIREKEAETASAIQVVNEATSSPVKRNTPIKLGLALFCSILLGIGLSMMLEYLDSSLRNSNQAEELYGLPVLATVPMTRSHNLVKRQDNIPILSSYEMVAGVLTTASNGAGTTVLVTGAEPGSGRSTTAANVAVALAQVGARVVLVDADMRKPTLHNMFGISNKPGLSNVLAGAVAVEDALMPTKVEGLLFMPAGPAPNNPIRLLRSDAMESFVKQIGSLADFVVFDSPSGAAFADAAVIAAYVKQVLIAHSAGRTATGAEKELKKKLDMVGARIAGVVLNRVRPEDSNFAQYRRAYSELGIRDKSHLADGGVHAISSRKNNGKDS